MWLSGTEVTGVGEVDESNLFRGWRGTGGQGRTALLTDGEDKAGQVWAASGCLQGGGSESWALPRELSDGMGQRRRGGDRPPWTAQWRAVGPPTGAQTEARTPARWALVLQYGGCGGAGLSMSKKFPLENSTREPFTGLPSWTSIHILPSPHRPGSALPEAPDP